MIFSFFIFSYISSSEYNAVLNVSLSDCNGNKTFGLVHCFEYSFPSISYCKHCKIVFAVSSGLQYDVSIIKL